MRSRFAQLEWLEPRLLGEPDQVELFDLKEDIGESKDVAEEMPEKVKELRDMLHKWRKESGVQMPAVRVNLRAK